jgi:hypothetical protein
MINIPNFEAGFVGRIFKDRTLGVQSDMTCIGYGDNQGNPYFVGMYVDTTSVGFKTVLVKNAEFTPKP